MRIRISSGIGGYNEKRTVQINFIRIKLKMASFEIRAGLKEQSGFTHGTSGIALDVNSLRARG